MTRILALDLSLSETGFHCPECGSDVIKTGDMRGMERVSFIAGEVLSHAARSDVAVIEDYAFSRANQAHQMGENGGVIRFLLYQTGLPWFVVSPQKLKLFATGKGNATKDQVLAAAIRKFDYEGDNNNEADALVLWHIGSAIQDTAEYQLHRGEFLDYELKALAGLKPVEPRRSCRVCGCTDVAACETDDNPSGRCMWVEKDLCSRCA